MPGLDPGILSLAGKKDRRVKPGEGERGGGMMAHLSIAFIDDA